jgi:hypothetical protein
VFLHYSQQNLLKFCIPSEFFLSTAGENHGKLEGRHVWASGGSLPKTICKSIGQSEFLLSFTFVRPDTSLSILYLQFETGVLAQESIQNVERIRAEAELGTEAREQLAIRQFHCSFDPAVPFLPPAHL